MIGGKTISETDPLNFHDKKWHNFFIIKNEIYCLGNHFPMGKKFTNYYFYKIVVQGYPKQSGFLGIEMLWYT